MVGFFGLAIWTARQAGKAIPPGAILALAIPLAVPLGAAYTSYYFSREPLLPLSALAIGTMFGYSLALLLKKRLSPN
jgi:hypothetical protein